MAGFAKPTNLVGSAGRRFEYGVREDVSVFAEKVYDLLRFHIGFTVQAPLDVSLRIAARDCAWKVWGADLLPLSAVSTSATGKSEERWNARIS